MDATSVAPGLSANRPTIVWRYGSWHDNIASPLHRRLPPWDAQNKSIIVHSVGLIAGCLWLEVDDQKICLDLDADDVVADEVSVITFCGILGMPADGGCDASLDLGRRHPAHRSGTPGLSVQER